MTCEDFLEGHSEFLDGRAPAVDALRYLEHMEQCAACARYDRVVRRSGELLRELPVFHASEALADRVEARISSFVNASPRNWSAFGWSLATAAVLAGVAWGPLGRVMNRHNDGRSTREADVISFTQGSVDPAFDALMWVSAPTALPVGTRAVQINTRTAVNAGPYSPLIVQPPAFEAAPPPRRIVWEAMAPNP